MRSALNTGAVHCRCGHPLSDFDEPRLAYNSALLSRVCAAFADTVMRFYASRPLDDIAQSGQSGAITVVQRIRVGAAAPICFRAAKLSVFDVYVQWTYDMHMSQLGSNRGSIARARGERLGFRVDAKTKRLVERAARLERRNVTDFCVTALTDAAKNTIESHSSIVLSEADRTAFFDTLVKPAKAKARLRRAFQAERELIKR